MPPDTVRKLILSVGTHRSDRPLSPVEAAEAMQKALDAGTDVAELAHSLHLEDTTMIRRFTRLLVLPSQVRPLVGWGASSSTLPFTAASELGRLDTEDEQTILARAVLENRLTTSEVKQVVQIRRRSRRPIKDSIKAVLRQRPVIERRHVIVGALRSENLREQLNTLSQSERDDLLRRSLKRYGPDILSLGMRLGNKYFVLVGDEDFHSVITSLPGGFEEAITEYLSLELASGD